MMHQNIKRYFILVILFLSFLNLHAIELNDGLKLTSDEKNYLQMKKEITMCIDPDWMPYEKIQNGKHIGMSADFIYHIQNKLDIPITLVPTTNWSQSIEYGKNRKCDIFSLVKETPSRKKYMNFTQPYFNFPVVLATTSEKLYISNIENVLNKPLGIVKGYALIELLKMRYPSINIIEVDSPMDGLKRVKNLEIYGYVDSLITIGYELQRNFVNELKVSGQLELNFSLAIASRNDEPLLHSIMQKATSSVSEKAKQKIINDWISIKVQKGFDNTLLWQIMAIVGVIFIAFIYRQFVLNKANNLLEKKVNNKTVELQELNNTLERTVNTRTEELQESIQEFHHLFQTTMEAIFISQYDYCLDANNEALKLFGFKDADSVVGTYLFDLIDKEKHEYIKNEENIESKPFEVNAIKHDGSTFPAMVKIHSYSTKNKTVKVIAIIDLTKLKEQELTLIKQSKMAGLAELIGNIAHQWRQPLAVISTAASGMQMQKELDILSDEELDSTCESIIESSQYLSSTIDDFRHLIKSDNHKNNFELHQPIKKGVSLLQGLLDSNGIQVETSFDKEIEIFGFENELTQTILNIIRNASNALEEKNRSGDRYIFITTSTQDDKITITIKDNGGGIDSDIIDKIFEPYFTTKHQSRGTGLGLYMVHQFIVDNLKGQVDVRNVEYDYNNLLFMGAEFSITFEPELAL
jgi:PAS domain S-box-containing protein